MGMRIFAAIAAAMLGTAVAFAQSDPNVRPVPASEAKAKAASKKPARKRAHAEAKQKTKAAETKKPAQAKAKPADKNDKDDKDAAKPKSKTASTEKTATNGSASAAAPEMKSGLREAYTAMPVADRIALQSDLIWTGDYNGLIDGQFSDRLVEAVTPIRSGRRASPPAC